MTKNWKLVTGPVELSNRNCDRWTFDCISEAAGVIRAGRLHMCEHKQTEYSPLGRTVYFSDNQYILRDSCGLIVPKWRIEEEILKLPPKAKFYKLQHTGYDHDRDFRKSPLKWSGKRRSQGRYYRHMKTMSEIRQNVGLEEDQKDIEDFPVRVKNRKKRKNLPTLWDDIWLARRGDGWKKYRKTQYKV